MVEVKTFLVKGRMLISHDRFPEWRKFEIYVRGVKPEDAVEKIYSELGSRHKLKRYHIRIDEVREVPLEEVEDLHILQLAELTRWVKE